MLPHQLKDTVGRALSGRLLSRLTLGLFVAAFGFSAQEEERLWRLWRGTGRITVLAGPRAMRSGAAAEVAGVLGPRRHQTVSLHDHIYVGADRRPAGPGPCRWSRPSSRDSTGSPTSTTPTRSPWKSGRAAPAAPGPFRRIGDVAYATDIPLAHSLGLGETLTLEYWTSYHYDGNPADPEEREYRRAVMNTLENFDMRVSSIPTRCRPRSGGRSGMAWKAGCWNRSRSPWTASTRRTATSGRWSGRWWASTGAGSRLAPCPSIGSVSDAQKAVIAGGEAARDSAASLAQATGDVINQALREMASRLTERAPEILAANSGDMADGQAAGLGQGLLDRLRLDPGRMQEMARQIGLLAAAPFPPETTPLGDLAGGPSGGRLRLAERRVPVGVIGANFEARPNVTIDIASQLLKSRNAGVLRTGGAALRSAAALADHVIAPAVQAAGLDPRVVQLVRSADREAAVELVRQPDLIPLVILRGSGETTRSLAAEAARAGVRTLAHADGGGVLYLDRAADPALAAELIDGSLDRLGVCNRLNLLLVAHRGVGRHARRGAGGVRRPRRHGVPAPS